MVNLVSGLLSIVFTTPDASNAKFCSDLPNLIIEADANTQCGLKRSLI